MYRVLGADQQEYGPVGADQIRQWIVERRLNASSLIQAEGGTAWKPISMFPEFATTLSAAAPISPSAVQPGPMTTASTNGMAITGLIFSAMSLVCCCIGPAFAVLGIVFSVIGLSQLKNNPNQGGRSLAIAGIVIGAVGLLEFVLLLFFGAFAEAIEKFGR